MSDNLGRRWQSRPLPVVERPKDDAPLTGWLWVAAVSAVIIGPWLLLLGLAFAIYWLLA